MSSRSQKGTLRKAGETSGNSADSICYCNGERELGTLELFCSGCRKWFHGKCLKDLPNFYGLPFMVCYVFHCKDCDSSKTETWIAKQANFMHMCVTALANLTADRLKKEGKLGNENLQYNPIFFTVHDQIIPYFEKNWELLTSMTRRVKNTWHATLLKTLSKEYDLFTPNPSVDASYALSENISTVGPANEFVKQIGSRKAAGEKNNLQSTLVQAQPLDKVVEADEGPKTRGASKRRHAENVGSNSKKPRLATDYSSAKIAGSESAIDFPFNKEGYRYFLVERDPNVTVKNPGEDDDSFNRVIPSHLYRVVTNESVTISPNDRAYQLKVGEDHLTVTGFEGYCLARATHSVSKGTWYYEVQFLQQPESSHIRIGWSQGQAVVQSCVGYNKLSYGWRSLKGTKFHDAKGKHYSNGGFKEGDVLGLKITLPDNPRKLENISEYLPEARKDSTLINFKHNYFYEVHDDIPNVLKQLKQLPGSKIEFYLNGKSCGVAFEDIYQGFYYPSVSIFGAATVKLNFGPTFRHLPRGARPMSERPIEEQIEASLSDIIHLVDGDLA